MLEGMSLRQRMLLVARAAPVRARLAAVLPVCHFPPLQGPSV